MALKKFKPNTPGQRGLVLVDKSDLFKGKPIKKPIPIVVVWLVIGAIFFTIKMRFINFKGFKHAIDLVAGKYSNPNDKGEVSHFQALATALSATVGLGLSLIHI